ncbi:hypothetical protein FJY90_07605 [Candidatus Gottesmanbacteria bacterium]|nr:hypothetical protein [Candidatus Gottesmanbacteria bacterium]
MIKKSVSISLVLILLIALGAMAEVGISKIKPEKYKVAEAAEGTKYYVDREYNILKFPAGLKGAQLLMTGNDDKNSKGDGFITFDVNQPATVYIGHDSRGEKAKGGVPPEWLSKDFTFVENMVIEVSDTNMGAFNLWKKAYKAGTVSLGGNADPPAAGQGSMYIVLVIPSELIITPSSVKPSEKLSITWAGVKNSN